MSVCRATSLLNLFFITFALTCSYVKTEECKTPNNETAQCVSLFSCFPLLNAVPDLSKRDFLTKSNCGGTPKNPMVCCGTKSDFTTKTKVQERFDIDKLLPSQRICGLQHSDDYYTALNGTVVTESPWLAFIVLTKEYVEYIDFTRVFCTGCLISGRYVLTSAFCLSNYELKPTRVHLGEYHLYNKTDCITERGLEECSEPIRDYGIEKIILHPAYKIAEYLKNNIAMLRLDKDVFYSDYIRPICLPLAETKWSKTNDILKQSGWVGANSLAAVKRVVSIQLAPYDDCKEKIQTVTNSFNDLSNKTLCGKLTKDAVLEIWGNTGAPLTASYNAKWYLQGISSEVIVAKNIGMVYTKVAYYIDWIKENIEP